MVATVRQATAGQSVQTVEVANPQEVARLLATLTAAFINDPPNRWLYPEPDRYLEYFPAFARAFGGGALAFGTAWRTRDFSACALWFPPGAEPEEQPLIQVIEDSVPPQRQAEVFALFEAMGEVHPAEPHWYLPLIGVDAACQGRGLGGALLRETLAVCDRDGVSAYLEATHARNVPFYERHGFRGLAPLRVGSCPPITPMWREPDARQGQW